MNRTYGAKIRQRFVEPLHWIDDYTANSKHVAQAGTFTKANKHRN